MIFFSLYLSRRWKNSILSYRNIIESGENRIIQLVGLDSICNDFDWSFVFFFLVFVAFEIEKWFFFFFENIDVFKNKFRLWMLYVGMRKCGKKQQRKCSFKTFICSNGFIWRILHPNPIESVSYHDDRHIFWQFFSVAFHHLSPYRIPNRLDLFSLAQAKLMVREELVQEAAVVRSFSYEPTSSSIWFCSYSLALYVAFFFWCQPQQASNHWEEYWSHRIRWSS